MNRDPRTPPGLRRAAGLWLAFAVVLAIVLLSAPLLGSTRLDWSVVFQLSNWALPPAERPPDIHVLLSARIPRILFAAVAGAALALAGCVYQAVLRNDLADPYTLGVSGGASVGALLAFQLAPVAMTALLAPIAAFATAGAGVGLILLMARSRGPRTSPATLILAGVTLNFLFGACILSIQYIGDPYQTTMVLRWLMGGVDGIGSGAIVFVAILVLLGLVFFQAQARPLNLLSLGEASAHHLGVPVESTRIATLAAASALAASVVAYAGPIGFSGLMVPHMTRRITGADHRVLLPAAALGGAALLVACDTIARTILSPAEMPVGIITAFAGAPFFLWLLVRKDKG
jgi:iron complex transport system permease protein